LADEYTANKMLVLLGLTGLVSGLVTSIFTLPAGDEAGFMSGMIFGSLLTGSLAISGVVPSVWKAQGMIVVATVAYALSLFTAICIHWGYPQIVRSTEKWDVAIDEAASPIALFVGGLIGGFLVLGAVALFLRPGIGKGAVMMTASLGAVLGGTLGVAGWALRSSVGVAVWHFFHVLHLTPHGEQSPRTWFHGGYDYENSCRMYSIYVVWQTGFALAAGIVLRGAPKTQKE
jgi:hypothetical protein